MMRKFATAMLLVAAGAIGVCFYMVVTEQEARESPCIYEIKWSNPDHLRRCH